MYPQSGYFLVNTKNTLKKERDNLSDPDIMLIDYVQNTAVSIYSVYIDLLVRDCLAYKPKCVFQSRLHQKNYKLKRTP